MVKEEYAECEDCKFVYTIEEYRIAKGKCFTCNTELKIYS